MGRVLFIFLIFQTGFLTGQIDSLVLFHKIGVYNLTNEHTVSLIEKLEKIDGENFELEVIGSADFIDTNPFNQQLSENRAKTVVDFIFEKFPEKFERISFRGIGEQPSGKMPEDEKIGIQSHRTTTIFIKKKTREAPIVIEKPKPTQSPEPKPKLTLSEKFKDLKPGEKLILKNMNFFPGRHVLRPISIPIAKELAQILEERPSLEIEIQGHICCGDQIKEKDGFDFDTREQKLSVNRAKNIYQFLIKKGIDKNRLSYKGFGFDQPMIYPERSKDDQNLNRRVEIKVVKN